MPAGCAADEDVVSTRTGAHGFCHERAGLVHLGEEATGSPGGPRRLTGSVRSETRCGLFPARPYGGG
ncbi:hypothetical protein ACKI2C_07920 [Streptomyces brasiliscabiei]